MNPATQTENYRNQPLTGALCVLIASFVFAILGALVKVVSSSLPNEMVVFFRNICALVFILPWYWYSRPFGGIRTNCFQFHLLRGITGLGAMYCFFYAIARLQLSEAYLLIATAPLFIPAIAYVWMGEPVARNVRRAIIIGFIGIVLILKPGFGIIQPAALAGLGAGVFAALAMVSIRRMSATEPVIRIVFYFTFLSTVLSAGPLLWSWRSPQPAIWWLLVLIGLLATIGQFFLTKGYSYAPAAQVGPFTYSNVVFAILIGWIFWEEALDLLTWAGALLTCIAGIITTRRTETHVIVGATAGTTPYDAGNRSSSG
ncbi:MAG: DMT family transporter [Desulfobacterales bacterium]|uniref:DMT family transporter n=1 Tax=Candidatus Desulfatibia vada TaxID=2841696 RepID=A0A8J6P160_9BACT|nr:DMT family transporter [Candidatus Desulfatibia vada]MBL6971349.1 DMT family transporter [Desulfobacterales bacterium]